MIRGIRRGVGGPVGGVGCIVYAIAGLAAVAVNLAVILEATGWGFFAVVLGLKKADRQANWSVKTNSQRVREFVYGWKLHLLVDCETEMPISANVSPGNVHDSKRASNLLSEARYTCRHFKPQFVIADKGYSSKKLRYLIRGQYWSHPIIAVHPTHAKARAKEHPEASEFKALLKQRQAVERVFARLKGQRALNKITVRGKMKVQAHCLPEPARITSGRVPLGWGQLQHVLDSEANTHRLPSLGKGRLVLFVAADVNPVINLFYYPPHNLLPPIGP